MKDRRRERVSEWCLQSVEEVCERAGARSLAFKTALRRQVGSFHLTEEESEWCLRSVEEELRNGGGRLEALTWPARDGGSQHGVSRGRAGGRRRRGGGAAHQALRHLGWGTQQREEGGPSKEKKEKKKGD